MESVRLQNIAKAFGATQVLRDINITVAAGEMLVLVGPSGCGKSTLLRLIAGLEEATSGAIFIGDEEVTAKPAAERGLSMVFQNYALYPHKTVAENLGFALHVAGQPRAEVAARVREAAEILNLTELLTRKPAQLSGGQRQRVAIGRAIVRKPRVFLFDEPLSNLDAALRARMRVEIAKLHSRLRATMIYVTHDQVEAMTLADRIVVLSAGRVEQSGAPLQLYENPANQFVATFLGSPQMNILPCAAGDSAATVQLPGGETIRTARQVAPGAPAAIGIRPEHISLVDADGENQLHGRVALAERLGADTFLHIDLPAADNQSITARLPANCPATAGDAVTVHLPAAEVHWFDEKGPALTRESP